LNYGDGVGTNPILYTNEALVLTHNKADDQYKK